MVTIHITGVHFTVSEKAKEHIAEKFGALDRLYPRLSSLHVTIHEAEKFGYRVDVDLHLPSGKDVVAHDTEENLFSAIDVTAEKCAAQLRKIHDRETAKVRDREPARLRA
mgnify:CR=1 FL=1